MEKSYRNKTVLVTGGLGFIGSNLAIRLASYGAKVTILDALWPDHGGNHFNIEPIKGDVEVVVGDIRDKDLVENLVPGKEVVFHLAGQCSHVLGQSDPYPDIDINIHGTAVLLEAVKKRAPKCVFIYTSTRGVYGSVDTLPVSEEAQTQPKGLYELSNLTAEKVVEFYRDIHGLKVVNLRLSNVYGERSQMKHAKFGVVNWFVRLALMDEPIKLFGDGRILRDFLYVDDCVEAILRCGCEPGAWGHLFNVGHTQHLSFLELVKTLVAVVNKGRYQMVPFTKERLAQEPGDFYPDITKIKRIVGWHPKTELKAGLLRTAEYYQKHKDHYWE